MTYKDLIALYDEKKQIYGKDAYRYISELLKAAKEQHKIDFLAKPPTNLTKIPDHEQSWRAFKGKNLEKLIRHIIEDEIKCLGLLIADGSTLDRLEKNLTAEMSQLKRNLLVDFGEFGYHLPDIDLVIYEPLTSKVVAVLSSKVTLRERIAQTGYWKLKLESSKATKHIKIFFITLDEDGTLTHKEPAKKGRAIVETDTDGCYVLSETDIEKSNNVKMFDAFISDLQVLIKKGNY